MQRVIGYCRVSKREQGLRRNGIEAQRGEITRFCEQNGMELVELVEEVASGSLGLDRRLVLAGAIQRAKKTGAILMVQKLDRLSRSVELISALMVDRKLQFVAAQFGADVDKFTLHIHAAIAERERQQFSERIKAGLAVARSKGVVLGNHPSSRAALAKGRQACSEDADAFAARLKPMITRMLQANMSLNAISRELNSQNTPTARGGAWSACSVSNLIKRWQPKPKGQYGLHTGS